MNVHVESNFLLELVFEQEEAAACEDLLTLAEQGALRLVVPLFALIEPQWTVNRRAGERRDLGRLVEETHQQLRRNTSLGPESQRLSGELDALLTLCEQQEDVLGRRTRERLLARAAVLSADAQVLREADKFTSTHGLQYLDAIMFASVLQDLAGRRADKNCFINKNTKDFAVDSVRQVLTERSCKFLGSFRHGQAFVRAELGRPPTA